MRWLFLLFILPGLAFGAVSNVATTSRDAVSLVSAANAAPGGKAELALHFILTPGWHIYWSNPGDAGLPPQIVMHPPAAAGAFTYPPPELFMQGPVAAYVLSGDFLLPFAASGISNQVSADANWLVCADICVPEHAHFTLALAGGASAEAKLFTPPQVVSSPFAARIAPDGTLSVTGPTRAQVRGARFFPDASGALVNRAAQPLRFHAGGMALQLTTAPGFDASKTLSGVLELTDPSGRMQALQVAATPGGAASTPLAIWFGLALLAGLILNLMPCVFPVLAMKVAGLARIGGAAPAAIRREALGYTAGVLAAMLLLGAVLLLLRGLGLAVGWGFQLQSPVFVAILGLLMLAVALNLAGIVAMPALPGLARWQRQGSFFTGLLAVAVATPCTAPFMGGAIAAALAAPPAAALGIFLSLGLGLAAPFLLIGFVPALGRALPRPGRWMVLLQRVLSVPMFATFLWLGWVFVQQAEGATPLTLPNAQPYSAARLAALRAAGTPVFVDMTAAWCITCLVNDRTTLDTQQVQRAFVKTGTKVLVGDWTRRDPAITMFLQQNGRDGVPLYIYYAPRAAGLVLPQILNPGMVIGVLR